MVVVAAEAKMRKEKFKCQRERGCCEGGGEGTANGTARKEEEEEEEKAMAKGKSGIEGTCGWKSGSPKNREIQTRFPLTTAFVSSCKTI